MKSRKLFIFLIICLFGFVPVLWFIGKGEVLINGVDTNFPLDPVNWFLRRFYVWNPITNSGQDFSASTAGLFFHFIQVVPFVLGFSLKYVEIFSLIFWFFALVLSSFYFSRKIIPNSILAQLIFVIIFCFNTYLFNTWENVKVANLALMVSIPLGLGILFELWFSKLRIFKVGWKIIILGFLLAGSGINPAYFLTFFLCIFIFLLVNILGIEKRNMIKRLGEWLMICCFIFLLNSYWILPSANFILKTIPASNSIAGLGFNNWLDSLSENTSLLNVLRVQGAWDWYAFENDNMFPLYIPYALNYFRNIPFVLFSYIFPALAILSLVLYKKEKIRFYVFFTTCLIIGVFLGAGTHEPTGEIYRLIIKHVPFFSLFRSPWYIFTPLVILAYSGLLSLLYFRLNEIYSKRKIKVIFKKVKFDLKIGYILNSLAVIFLVGNLIYCYPLIQGKIFRPEKDDSFFVSFPKYVFDVENWLRNNQEGRIISYPDDELERFDWGYRGIESILQLLYDNEVIYKSLTTSNERLNNIIYYFYESLMKNQTTISENLANKMGARWIFEKNDQQSLAPELPYEVRNKPNIKFDKWIFYDFIGEDFEQKINSPEKVYLSYPYDDGYKNVGMISADSVVVNPDDSQIKKIKELEVNSNKVIKAENMLLKLFNEAIVNEKSFDNYIERDLNTIKFNFEIPSDDIYKILLSNYRLNFFGIDQNKILQIKLDGKNLTLVPENITKSYVQYRGVGLEKGNHQIELIVDTHNLLENGDFNQPVLFKQSGKGEVVYENGYYTLFNKGRENLGVNFDVLNFDPFSKYFISGKYRNIKGGNGGMIASQTSTKFAYKHQLRNVAETSEWTDYGFFFDPIKTDSWISVGIVAMPSGINEEPFGTKVSFDNLSIKEVFSNELFLISENNQFVNSVNVNFTKKSPVHYEGSVKNGQNPHIIEFLENYSPDWEFSYKVKDQLITTKPLHFTINYYANGWFLEGMPDKYDFEINYKPQRYYILGMVITLSTILFLISANIYSLKKFKNDKE